MQALPDRVTVLVDAAYEAHEVDIDRARQDRSEALQRQSQAGGDLDAYRREQSIVDFANAQLHVAGAS